MNMIILFVGISVEVIFASFVVWGYLKEEKLVAFEDKIIRAVIRRWRRIIFKIKAELLSAAHVVFIFFYRPYRRMKKRILKRLLRQFGLCAVRCEQVRGYEVLSR